MTRYMLDTNTVSHLLKKHPAVARRVVAAPITSLCISAITQGELLVGLARRPDATALPARFGSSSGGSTSCPGPQPRPRFTAPPVLSPNARAGCLRRWTS